MESSIYGLTPGPLPSFNERYDILGASDHHLIFQVEKKLNTYTLWQVVWVSYDTREYLKWM